MLAIAQLLPLLTTLAGTGARAAAMTRMGAAGQAVGQTLATGGKAGQSFMGGGMKDFDRHMKLLPPVIGKATRAIKDWITGLVASGHELKRFDSRIQTAYAEMERANIVRQVGSAQRTGGSRQALTESYTDFLDAMQPGLDALTNIQNNVASIFLSTAASATKWFQEIPGIKQLLESINQNTRHAQSEKAIPWLDFMQQLSDGRLSGRKGDFIDEPRAKEGVDEFFSR